MTTLMGCPINWQDASQSHSLFLDAQEDSTSQLLLHLIWNHVKELWPTEYGQTGVCSCIFTVFSFVLLHEFASLTLVVLVITLAHDLVLPWGVEFQVTLMGS